MFSLVKIARNARKFLVVLRVSLLRTTFPTHIYIAVRYSFEFNSLIF